MKKSLKITSVILAFILIALLLGGCKGPDSTDVVPSSVAVAVSKNLLTGSLSLNSSALNNAIRDAAMNVGSKVSGVIIDGEPAIFADHVVEADANNNSASRRRQIAANTVNAFGKAISAVTPSAGEIDIIEGLNLSIDAMSSSNASGNRYIYVLSNGLSTSGIFDFNDYSVFESDVDRLADEGSKYLKDCSNITFYWLNIGDVNTAVQDKFDVTQQKMLMQLYTRLIENRGGTVQFLSDKSNKPVDTSGYPSCTPVYVPRNTISGSVVSTKLSEETVGFRPNTAELIDEASAKSAIKSLSEELATRPDTVNLVGSTASYGDTSNCLALSVARCEVIRNILIEQGISPDRIRIYGIGRGESSSFRVKDTDDSGRLIENEAKKNRFVLVTTEDVSSKI